jgi:hypothetical protein
MPVRVIFRCQFCAAVPGAATQRSLEGHMREWICGEYLDALPERWLVWHGHGPFGPMRYACPEHRGELTAYLREHYGAFGPQAWKRPPYATTRRDAYTDRAIRRAAGGSRGGWPG